MTMDDLTERQRMEAARIRDEAAAAAQGDRSAWAHLLDVIHAPDALIQQLRAENERMFTLLTQGQLCPQCGYHIYLSLEPSK